jgi:AcrR family transcriptional regulator
MGASVRRARPAGQRTRTAILRRAADLASIHGLSGLSIGRLASELGMSKSGVFAHFGSMEELQLATVELAGDIYAAEIVQPALREPPGIGRLVILVDAFLSYSERHVFPGGCFFRTTISEFESRPGRLRDRFARAHRDWIAVITRTLDEMQQTGDIDPGADTGQVAFEIAAVLTAADLVYNLYQDRRALDRGRKAALRSIANAGTDRGAATGSTQIAA